MSATSRCLAFARSQRSRFVAELAEFVRFPSVSAQPQHVKDVSNCAAWLAAHLRKVGFDRVQVIPTRGHPIVYSDWLHVPRRPTVLVYGHYDVQPVDPIGDWLSPPFEPVVRGDNMFGRGASDDKGQMFTHVKAAECLWRTTGSLPVNVKCIFEGEEEIGSTNLPAFLHRHCDAIAADVAILSDSRMLGTDRPVITESLRGGLSVELQVRGQGHDLHSGNFGGAVHNPLQALCEIVAGLHGADGRISIPGLYDQVRELSGPERAYMRRFGPSDAAILAEASARHGWGEAGYTLYERTTIRPALTINGLTGGYQGPATKAVIPAHASAKLNFRLVPDQDPQQIDRLFRSHVEKIAPPSLQVVVRTDLAAKPASIERSHPAIAVAAAAYLDGFGALPVFVRSGGTIPVVNLFQEMLGIPTVLMEFALPDDGLHAPNEKFHMPTFFNAIATSINSIIGLAAIGRDAFRTHRDAPLGSYVANDEVAL